MNRVIRTTLVGLGLLAVAGTTSAQARCNLGCLTHKVSSLQTQVNQDTRALRSLAVCLHEAPVTQYGSSSHSFGYVYNPGGSAALFSTTGLDGTAKGDHVSVWMMIDACNKRATAASDAPGGFAPLRSYWTQPPVSRRVKP